MTKNLTDHLGLTPFFDGCEKALVSLLGEGLPNKFEPGTIIPGTTYSIGNNTHSPGTLSELTYEAISRITNENITTFLQDNDDEEARQLRISQREELDTERRATSPDQAKIRGLEYIVDLHDRMEKDISFMRELAQQRGIDLAPAAAVKACEM